MAHGEAMPFGGAELLVGEVVGVRTFRVDDMGTLLPLYSNGAWYDGANEATCSPPTGTHPRGAHRVPADDCECGFYAYGSLEALRAQRQSRFVVAVVSCWGNVVAGTLGVRAEYARVDALWLAPSVPSWLRRRIAVRYPSARLFSDQRAMLAEYPLTALEGYEPAPHRHPVRRAAGIACVAAVLSLGLLPVGLLHGSHAVWDLWMVVTTLAVAFTAWLAGGVHWAGHFAAAMVMCGVVAWLVAPLFGLAGWILRAPLIRGALVGAGGFAVTLLPHYFPVVSTPRERPFCGVRSA
jgi:hypothetical protein